MSPIMEILTGIMIAILIFYSGKLIAENKIDIGDFFSFLAAMMLAYQPVRALSSLVMVAKQGLSAASRILPIIDQKNEINEIDGAQDLKIKEGEIEFKNIVFSYEKKEEQVLNSINLKFNSGKMTSLVGHRDLVNLQY